MSSEGGREPKQRGAPELGLTGIVLVGGRSRRMGSDKCELEIAGRTLLQRVVDALGVVADEVLVVAAPERATPQIESPVPLRQVADPYEGGGPLVGIAAGLAAAAAPVALIVACDLPGLQPALLRLLAQRAGEGVRLVVPLHEGVPQLLCAAWRREALPLVRARLDAGDRAVADLLEALDVELLPPEAYAQADPEGRSFVNVNTPEDLAVARARAVGSA